MQWMKRFALVAGILALGVIAAVLVGRSSSSPEESTTETISEQTPEQSTVIPGGERIYGATFVAPEEPEYYLSLVNTDPSSTQWKYRTSLQATTETGNLYDQGAFCRVFSRATESGYDVTYGGGFGKYVRSYSGVIHRFLGQDLAFSGSAEPLENAGGGDIGIDTDGEFFYVLLGHPKGWSLKKYDADFKYVDQTVIELPAGHANNDMTLRYVNGMLMAVGLYDPAYTGVETKITDPDAPTYLHVWMYTTDLAYVDDVILDDTSSINGATIIHYDSTYAIVSADHFIESELIAMLYDEDWNFLRKVDLQEGAQWSMGGEEHDGQLYIAYHKGPHEYGDVFVDIYDKEWNLQETIEVTDVGERTPERAVFAQHPWIEFDGDRMFVAYTLGEEVQQTDAHELTLTCMLSVYEER